jgi:SAM-dependent methyltransferase
MSKQSPVTIKWHAEAGLRFIQTGSADIVKIDHLLYALYSDQAIVRLLREAARVLRPETGVLRISESYREFDEPAGRLNRLVLSTLAGLGVKMESLGPFRTNSGDARLLHALHPKCLLCAQQFFRLAEGGSIRDDERAEAAAAGLPLPETPPDLWAQCWPCHLQIIPQAAANRLAAATHLTPRNHRSIFSFFILTVSLFAHISPRATAHTLHNV